jgi:hypothetical protein
MTSLRTIAVSLTSVAVLCGAAVLWQVYKHRAAERKLAEAAKVIRARAESGEADAQFSLGNSYRKGEGVPQDDAESVRWFRQAAEHGDLKAQYSLGVSYSRGLGVPRDYVEAVRWYRQAADQGYAMAQYALGFMYYKGQGVPQDYAEAARWLRIAAEQGDRTAQSVLGFMYDTGRGTPRDSAEALRWYRKAGEQGDRTAQAALTIIYYKGQAVPKDYAQALHWFGKLAVSCFMASQGGPLARWTSIGALLLALPILVPQRRWGRRAAWMPWALGSASSASALAHELLSGSSMALFAQGLLGTLYRDSGRVLWLVFLAGASVFCAIGAVVNARRGPKQHSSTTSDGAAIPSV